MRRRIGVRNPLINRPIRQQRTEYQYDNITTINGRDSDMLYA
jgi:hypothetical protein